MTDSTSTAAPPTWVAAVCQACGDELSPPTFGMMHRRCVRRLLNP